MFKMFLISHISNVSHRFCMQSRTSSNRLGVTWIRAVKSAIHAMRSMVNRMGFFLTSDLKCHLKKKTMGFRQLDRDSQGTGAIIMPS